MTEQYKNERPEIYRISVEFSQSGNTLGTTEEHEELEVALEFQIGEEEGPFYVLKSTKGWSVDDIDDLKKLIDTAKAPLNKIREVFPEDKYEVK
jgi:hypothetical protein